jgi:ABC-type multidrug transport system ATPase subunit
LTPLLVADSIGKSFGTRRVLVSARLEAQPGFTFVAGRNGAGKSTLLKIAAGYLSADYGIIKFAGETFHRPSLHQLARRGLFFLPDRGILAPYVKLRKQIAAVAARFATGPFEPVAEAFGLTHLMDHTPRQCSTGELRRAELCLAVVRSPTCLIADEPLRGIDPKDAELLLAQLHELARRGCAVVVSGHDPHLYMSAADYVAWVTSGTCYNLGRAADARKHDQFHRHYLTGSWV